MSIVARESKTFTLDFTLLTTDYILLQFEKHKRLYTNDAIFAPIFNSGQDKMDKYYNLTDKTPIYLIALILHLSRKWKYVKKNQRANQIQPKKEKVKDFQEKAYKPALSTSFAPPASLEATSNKRAKNDFFEQLKDNDDGDSIEDKYARYCALLQILGIKSGYKQWLELSQ